jgi:hypothetical protein
MAQPFFEDVVLSIGTAPTASARPSRIMADQRQQATTAKPTIPE